MIGWIVGSSLRFRGLVVALAAGLLAYGVVQLRDAPVDVLPEFTPPTVEIQTEALGLSANEVEQLITVPIEQDLLAGVAFVDEIRSQSVPGLSSIVAIFEPGTDLLAARQVISERMTQAHALPHVSRAPEMLQPLSSTSRVMMVGLSSEALSAIELSVLARWTIKPRLTGVPGVANVAVFGMRDRQLQVQVDPAQLRAQNVSLVQLLETTGNALWVSPLTFVEASTPGTGGFIDTNNQRLGIQHISPIKSADDLAQVSVEGTDLTLGEVATVVEDHQPLIGDANAGSGLVLVVEKFPEANTLEVTQGVEDALAEMQPGLAGVTFDTTIYRPATYIEESIDNITLALIIGGVLLAVGIGLLLFEWRAALDRDRRHSRVARHSRARRRAARADRERNGRAGPGSCARPRRLRRRCGRRRRAATSARPAGGRDRHVGVGHGPRGLARDARTVRVRDAHRGGRSDPGHRARGSGGRVPADRRCRVPRRGGRVDGRGADPDAGAEPAAVLEDPARPP